MLAMRNQLELYGPANDPSHVAQTLGSCCREAMDADYIAGCLDNLRSCIVPPLHPPLMALTEEIRRTSRLLRTVVENSRAHQIRVFVVVDHLDVLIPCLSRSLRDIKKYYEDNSMPKELRWRTMYHKMTDEASGRPLPLRFVLYNQFLILLNQMLTRSPDFDMNALEAIQNQILQLREKRGIEPPSPSQVGALVAQTLSVTGRPDRNVHWAEEIFSRPLPSRTTLKHLQLSRSYGPWGTCNIPHNSKILFRRRFDDDRLSVVVFSNPRDNVPVMVIRSRHLGPNNPVFSSRGIHALCIERDGSCLVLKRWSQNEHCSKLWAVLYFLTWEEMVLFHCTFVALKSYCELTKLVRPSEFRLHKEKRLFQARIIDDDFKHSLIVYQDLESGSIRLHAAVWDGELRQCPVWTAFITDQMQSSNTWLEQKDRYRIWLHELQLYVFCNVYRQEHMRQNKSGAFELDFVTEEGAQRFKEVFFPPPPTPPATDLGVGRRREAIEEKAVSEHTGPSEFSVRSGGSVLGGFGPIEPSEHGDLSETGEPSELSSGRVEVSETVEIDKPEEPKEPADNGKPSELAESAEPVEPVEPVEPAEPAEPVETAVPAETNHVEPEPIETTEPVDPAEPAESVEPAQPTEPVQSSEPNPTTDAGDQAKSNEPDEPDKQNEPNESGEQAEPTEPSGHSEADGHDQSAEASEPNASTDEPAAPIEEPVAPVDQPAAPADSELSQEVSSDPGDSLHDEPSDLGEPSELSGPFAPSEPTEPSEVSAFSEPIVSADSKPPDPAVSVAAEAPATAEAPKGA